MPWQLSGPIQISQLFEFYEAGYAAVRAQGFTGDIWVRDFGVVVECLSNAFLMQVHDGWCDEN